MTNVLLILADDMRADLLPFMPFVNGVLRPQGTEFANMRCSVPQCNPARAGLLTGQFAQGLANGVYDNIPGLNITNPEFDSLPVWLSSITTGMFGKYLLGLGGAKAPGWDTWGVLSVNEQDAFGYTITDGTTPVTPAEHQLTHVAGRVSTFVTTAPEPWFCFYAPTNPHINGVFTNNPLPSSIGKFSWVRWPFDLLTTTTGKPSWIASRPQFTTDELSQMRHNIRQQVREVYDLDGVIAGLYADLATANRLANTVIIFVTDSGVFYGEQRLGTVLTGSKNHPYDVVARVPCILRGPDIPSGTVATTPAVLQDVTATILGIFGAGATVPLDGLDLRSLIAAPIPDRATLYERQGFAGFPDGAGVVTATRKLMRWTGQVGDDVYEAYDLDVDRAERINWANDLGRSAERSLLESRLNGLLA